MRFPSRAGEKKTGWFEKHSKYLDARHTVMKMEPASKKDVARLDDKEGYKK